MIAAWMSDLNVILDVFNVRLIASSFTPLKNCLQTELETNTRVVVSNSHDISPGIHRTMVEQAADGWNPLVRTYFALSINECTLTVSQTLTRFAISTANWSSSLYFYSARPENLLLLHRVPVLDATSWSRRLSALQNPSLQSLSSVRVVWGKRQLRW
jgi:hypothetical protein